MGHPATPSSHAFPRPQAPSGPAAPPSRVQGRTSRKPSRKQAPRVAAVGVVQPQNRRRPAADGEPEPVMRGPVVTEPLAVQRLDLVPESPWPGLDHPLGCELPALLLLVEFGRIPVQGARPNDPAGAPRRRSSRWRHHRVSADPGRFEVPADGVTTSTKTRYKRACRRRFLPRHRGSSLPTRLAPRQVRMVHASQRTTSMPQGSRLQ
jgi:hypothetical protein